MCDSARHVKGTGPLAYVEDHDALRDATVDQLVDRLEATERRFRVLSVSYSSVRFDDDLSERARGELHRRTMDAGRQCRQEREELRRLLKKAFREHQVNVIHEVSHG